MFKHLGKHDYKEEKNRRYKKNKMELRDLKKRQNCFWVLKSVPLVYLSISYANTTLS